MRLLDYFKNPLVAGIAAGVIGLLLGLAIGWWLWPVQYTDAVPSVLTTQHQEDYLRMAIDSYKANPDPDLAWVRFQSLGIDNARAIFARIQQNPGSQDVGAILGFRSAIEAGLAGGGTDAPAGGETGGTDEPSQPASSSNFLIIALGGILALAVIVAAVYLVARRFLFGTQPSPEEYTPARQAQEINRAVEKTDFSKLGVQEPMARAMTTYVLGDDLYDESFSVNSPSGEYLGEYGLEILELVGVGTPQKVTAFKLSLFDFPHNKTTTKILMSDHAFADPRIRQKLEPKGELIRLDPLADVFIESESLTLMAKVVDLKYGNDAMPEQSYFERLTLEFAIWRKDSA